MSYADCRVAFLLLADNIALFHSIRRVSYSFFLLILRSVAWIGCDCFYLQMQWHTVVSLMNDIQT